MICKILLLSTYVFSTLTHSFDAFDDAIHFDVVWGDPKSDFKDGREEIVMKTENSEEYICQIPDPSAFQLPTHVDVDTSARDIIAKLEKDKACSYRVDSYWIYEVCHGRHIKQFHEERDASNKKVLVKQAFFLGYIDEESYQPVDLEPNNIPTINHAGALRPYYSITFRSGTDCDLIAGFKRQTVVYYLCMPDFQTSVVSVKEISTCKYEIIIYTSLLCGNKLYRIKEDPINHIYCLSVDGTKWKRPLGYELLEKKKADTAFKIPPGRAADGSTIPKEAKSATQLESQHPKSNSNAQIKQPLKSQLTFPEKTFVRHFLSGEKCVVGGTGWWKYEFCFQKSLKQFHKEKKGTKTEILLGIWDEKMHIDHVKESAKIHDTSKKVTHMDLFYFLGDICDETGLPRQVQVRIKCSQNDASLQALTMYLEEPSMCKYKFTTESVLFCKILDYVDEYGVPKMSLENVLMGI